MKILKILKRRVLFVLAKNQAKKISKWLEENRKKTVRIDEYRYDEPQTCGMNPCFSEMLEKYKRLAKEYNELNFDLGGKTGYEYLEKQMDAWLGREK